MSETIKGWLGALVAMPMLTYVAWTDPLMWPCAFLFGGMTACWIYSKIMSLFRDP